MPPSSAWMSASTMIMTPPMIQEMIAAGPAAIRPFWAPNSHPEPMIEPTDAQIRPTLPTSRTRDVERVGGGGEASVVAMMVSAFLLNGIVATGKIRLCRAHREYWSVTFSLPSATVQLDDEDRQHQLDEGSDRQRVGHRAEADDPAEQPAEDHDPGLERHPDRQERPA